MSGRYVTPDEAAMERCLSLTAIPCGHACASTRALPHRTHFPPAAGDTRGRPMGEPTAAARVRPTRPLRAPAGRRGRRRLEPRGFIATRARRRPTRFREVRWSADFRPARAPMVRRWCRKPVALQKSRSGGQGRNRTTDTRIFSPLLYQLSYLAIAGLLGSACPLRSSWVGRPQRGRVLDPSARATVNRGGASHASGGPRTSLAKQFGD